MKKKKSFLRPRCKIAVKNHEHVAQVCAKRLYLFNVLMSFYDCQKTILVQFAHVFLHVFQKIILVRYVHEFLSCLPKDYTCAMCSRVFKVIKDYYVCAISYLR